MLVLSDAVHLKDFSIATAITEQMAKLHIEPELLQKIFEIWDSAPGPKKRLGHVYLVDPPDPASGYPGQNELRGWLPLLREVGVEVDGERDLKDLLAKGAWGYAEAFFIGRRSQQLPTAAKLRGNIGSCRVSLFRIHLGLLQSVAVVMFSFPRLARSCTSSSRTRLGTRSGMRSADIATTRTERGSCVLCAVSPVMPSTIGST